MKLTRYINGKSKDTPLCIALLCSPYDTCDNFNRTTDKCSYILHVHFDGIDSFPGVITSAKLIYAIPMKLKHHEKEKGFKEAADMCFQDYDETNEDATFDANDCNKHIEDFNKYANELSKKLAN
ncbi:unnamed protein product [Didymodactylos carnosus]|uniref:Uncharacterized protein n=1 Tax=Didymodactylos carnosus TaxID=1234261 RepID=A0A815KA39_9BILA|nr:unnamed protein product [Didymodactylos carnosus]CAF1654521.1 unnamed protein product [Didymodactylos carnosus]CAF4287551.1 unnamed protein product [Didymodactylos carnosus]CAF4505681.1 unnamed protein product [Didymodactylos carnosus]